MPRSMACVPADWDSWYHRSEVMNDVFAWQGEYAGFEPLVVC